MSQVNELVNAINRNSQLISKQLDEQKTELKKLQNGLRAVVIVMLFPVLIGIAVFGFIVLMRMSG